MDTKDMQDQVPGMKARFAQLESENDRIVATAPIENGTVIIDDDRRDSFRRNLAEMKSLQGDIEAVTEFKSLREWGNLPANQSVAQLGAAQAQGAQAQQEGQRQYKSLGAAFIDSPEFKAMIQANSSTMASPYQIKGVDIAALANIQYKDVYTGMSTMPAVTDMGPVMRDPIVERPHRKVRVRDLFNVVPTTASLIEFFRVTGFTNAAATIKDWDTDLTPDGFGLKPQSTLTIVGDQAPVRTVAHWEVAHRNALDDVPQLQAIIDNELLYGLRLAEDDQILNGNGTAPNLAGILTNANIQTFVGSTAPTSISTDTKADNIRRAITKGVLAFYEMTGVVTHPNDWEDIELTKDAMGGYIIAVSVAMGGEQRLWRLPVVDTPAIAEGVALVGAFGLGATLYDRQEANIRIAEQHADLFIRNAVAILAEQRIALAIKRPESFVKVTYGAPA